MQVHQVSEAFDIEQVVPFFQPVMDLEHNAVWNYECLARLMTESEQAFLPSDFLQIIEQRQCFGQLTRTIFLRSAEYFRHLNLAWSINISRPDMLEAKLAKFLKDYLHFYPNPGRVSIEMTAELAVEYPEEFKSFLLLCKALDIRLFIDHFGACTSHLEQILALPIDGVKIDGNLINQLIKDKEVVEFVDKLNQMARQRDIKVIAEHIEDRRTLSEVDKLGIRYAQGFYFCEPSARTH